jgi:hypothetical protein
LWQENQLAEQLRQEYQLAKQLRQETRLPGANWQLLELLQ